VSHPYYHAVSSARRFGGTPEDYLAVHQFFDQTKAHLADCRHRLVLHNSFGIFLAEQLFGVTMTLRVGAKRHHPGVGRQAGADPAGRRAARARGLWRPYPDPGSDGASALSRGAHISALG
jgi:hypothetical protein